MKKICVLLCLILFFEGTYARKKQEVKQDDRMWWCETAYKIAYPVLDALSKGELKQRLPIEAVSPGATP